MRSVSQRLLVSITLLLLLFFGVMVAVLDARFQRLARDSLREQLNAQIVALILRQSLTAAAASCRD
jgi:sensor domain CHASE-containing protein